MGQCLSSIMMSYINSLLCTEEYNFVSKYETSFHLNGSNRSPLCQLSLSNTYIAVPDLLVDETSGFLDQFSLSVKCPIVTVDIEEAELRCIDLGYTCLVSGKVEIFDLQVEAAITPDFAEGLKIGNLTTKATMKKIQSEIRLHVNDADHSAFANALLSTDDPDIANNILNAVLLLQKDSIKDFLNNKLSSYI